jgi:hypothetical protein
MPKYALRPNSAASLLKLMTCVERHYFPYFPGRCSSTWTLARNFSFMPR